MLKTAWIWFLFHHLVRKLSLYKIQTVSHLRSENSCWTCWVPVASKVQAFKCELKGFRAWESMQLKLVRNWRSSIQMSLYGPIVHWMLLIRNGQRTMTIWCDLTARWFRLKRHALFVQSDLKSSHINLWALSVASTVVLLHSINYRTHCSIYRTQFDAKWIAIGLSW